MKQIKLLSLIAALALVSCVEEAAYDNDQITGNETPEVVNPDYTDYLTLVVDSEITKTALDGETVKWTEGDKIKIYFDGGSAESLGAVVSAEGTKASFTIPLTETLADDVKLYAVYPSTATATLEDDVFNVTIPSEQSVKFRNVDVLAAATTVADASLSFQHVAGIVSFVISDGNPKGIDSGIFKDFYKSAGIAGVCPLTFDETGKMTIGTPVETKSEISLKDIQSGENFIAILPDVKMESVGLKLKANGKYLTPKVSDNDLTVSAAHIKGLKTAVDVEMGDAYYIKAGATGKGTSWSDAAGVSLIEDLMSTPLPKADDTYQRRAAAWRLDGQEIRIAQGTYELAGTMNAETKETLSFLATYLLTKTTFAIKGGYNADGTANASAKATFTGNNAHPIMALWSGVDATISNIIFRDAKNDKYGDTASNGIGQVGGAIDLDNTSVVTFDNCEFINNKSTVYTGGALAITQNGTKATFKSCIFDGNESSQNGGAVFIGNAAATFDGCTFVRNKTTANGGGAIFFNNDAVNNTLTIKNSEFNANTATLGGAALLLSHGKKATIEGTTFKSNNVTSTTVNVSYYGVVTIAGNTTSTTKNANFNAKIHVDFKECDFLNNNICALNVSSIWPTNTDINSTYNGEYVSLNGCRFEGNTSVFKAAAVLVQGSLPTFMNACSFKNNSVGGTRTDSGVTVAMASGNSGWYGMLAMNNCTFSGGTFTNSPQGYVYLRGKSILSNSTVLGDGKIPALTYDYNANWGNSDGSILVNNIVCNESTDTNQSILISNNTAYKITGYYNLYKGLKKETNNTYNANSDTNVTVPYADFNFTESNYLFDYSIPSGTTVSKVPTVAEVETAIKSMTTVRKTGGKGFGTMFYDWLTSIGAADKDARGKARTTNRQGALVK